MAGLSDDDWNEVERNVIERPYGEKLKSKRNESNATLGERNKQLDLNRVCTNSEAYAIRDAS